MTDPIIQMGEPGVLKVRLTFTEECLGTGSADKDIHEKYIASLAPDAPSRKEEVEALGEEEVTDKGITVFATDDDGNSVLWDYQIKGFFKDACSMLRRTPVGLWSGKLSAHKKIIDGLIFPHPRRIVLHLPNGEELGACQRPIRINDKNGERVAIAHSRSVPIGTYVDIDIEYMELTPKKIPKPKDDKPKEGDEKPKKPKKKEDPEVVKAKALIQAPANLRNAIIEWLNYGKWRGIGQWRNSGKGRFTWEMRE